MEKISFDLSNSNIDFFGQSMALQLNTLHYPRDLAIRYQLLLEEGLLYWQEHFSNTASVTWAEELTKDKYVVTISIPGVKAEPYANKTAQDFFANYRDKLLTGTGREITAKYKNGINYIQFDLPRKDIRKSLFRRNALALIAPISLQSLLDKVMFVADATMLSFVDQNAFAAVSLLLCFISLYIVMLYGAVNSGSTLIAQYWGQRNRRVIGQITAMMLQCALPFGCLLSCLYYFFPGEIMHFLTNNENIARQGIIYCRAFSCFFIFSSVSITLRRIMVNTGRSLESSFILLFANLLNLTVNSILIFGLFGVEPMGTKGAALGSSTCAGIEMLLTLCCITHYKDFTFDFKDLFSRKLSLFRDFWNLTRPALAQRLSYSLTYPITYAMAGHLSLATIQVNALFTIYYTLRSGVVAGFGSATGIILGQELGRKNFDLAKEKARWLIRYVTYLSALINLGVLVWIWYVYKQHSYSPAVFNILTFFLPFILLEIFADSLNCVVGTGILPAGGDYKALFWCDTINLWVWLLPVCGLAIHLNAPDWLILILLKSEAISSFPYKFYRYKAGKWLKNLTTDEGEALI